MGDNTTTINIETGSGITSTVQELQNETFNDVTAVHIPYDISVAATGVAIIVGVFIFVLMAIGIVLNAGTIYAIIKTKEYKNVFSCFLLSLCISDLLSAIVSPFFWYRRTIGFDKWYISGFLCKFYWGIDMSASCATTLLILACTVVRFIGIKYPLSYKKITRKHAVYTSVVVWITCILFVFVPFAYFNDARDRNRSSHEEDAEWAACGDSVQNHKANTLYIVIATVFLLYIPMCLTTALYIAIVCIVKKRFRQFSEVSDEGQAKRYRREKRAVRQLMLVMVSFGIGYIPSAVYAIWTRTHKRYSDPYEAYDYWMLIVSYIFLRISECLDPVVYTLGSVNLKNYARHMISKTFPCCCKSCALPNDETFRLKNTSNTLSNDKTVSTLAKLMVKASNPGQYGSNRQSEIISSKHQT